MESKLDPYPIKLSREFCALQLPFPSIPTYGSSTPKHDKLQRQLHALLPIAGYGTFSTSLLSSK